MSEEFYTDGFLEYYCMLKDDDYTLVDSGEE